jgi:hypothetical protein
MEFLLLGGRDLIGGLMSGEVWEIYHRILACGFHLSIDAVGNKWFANIKEHLYEYGHNCDLLLIKYGMWNVKR